MSTTSGVSSTSGTTTIDSSDLFTSLTTSDFLKIIIAELTNQNPLDGSSESTSSKLTNEFLQLYTASSMQDMTTGVDTQTDQMKAMYAQSLVGAYVEVASDDAETETTGYVDNASIVDGEVTITVNGTDYKAANIINIIDPYSTSTSSTSTTTGN